MKINKKELFSIALKFISLLLFLNCLSNIIQATLEFSIPAARSLSLFGFSPFGPLVRVAAVILYGISGYILFRKSEAISSKVIKGGEAVASIEVILQLVVAYQGVSGIIFVAVVLILEILRNIPFLGIAGAAAIFNARTIIYLVEFAINLLLLFNYQKVAAFLLRIIPAKFWGE